MTYRAEIDGLRAIAVLVVILFHAHLMGPFQGGFIGVDVFFVLSGYLITGIIRAEQAAGNFSLLRFYERRARRILPALVLVCAVSVPLALLMLLPFELAAYFKSLGSVALFISNVYFWDQSGYFDVASTTQPLLHTWSLAVEEQFYLLFPLLLMSLSARGRPVLLGILVALFIASFALSVWGSVHKPQINFFFTPSRFWELLAGALCALWIEKRHPAVSDLRAGLGLGMILSSVAVFGPGTPFPSWATLLPVCGTVMVLLYAGPGGSVTRALSWRPLVGLGLISYSAYLWHVPILVLSELAVDKPPGPWVRGALVVLVLSLAVASWSLVEQPFRRRPVPLLPRRGQVFAASGAALSGLFAVGLAGMALDGGLSRYPPQTQALLVNYGDFRLTMRAFDLGHCFADMDQGADSMVAAGCLEAHGPDDIVLWGDSLAAHLSHGLKAESGRGLVQFTGASCRPFAEPSESARCAGLRTAFWAKNSLAPRNLVLAANWAGTAESEGETVLLGAVRDTLDQLRVAGFSVVLVGQSPSFPTHAWLRQVARAVTPVKDWHALAFNPVALNAKLARVASEEGARFYNPSERLCDVGEGMVPCLAMQGGQAIFADAGHFSVLGSELIARDMLDKGLLGR